MPIGSKTCDMCAVYGAGAPVQQPWQPPKEAAGATELAASAASWAVAPGAVRPPSEVELTKARKALRRAFRIFLIYGSVMVGLGAAIEIFNIGTLAGLGNWLNMGEGAVFLLLAYFTRGGSLKATVIGTALYVLDTVAMMYLGYFSIIRLFIIVALVQAVLSANFLRQQPKAAPGQDQSRAA